jgi:N-methylhydantoinase A
VSVGGVDVGGTFTDLVAYDPRAGLTVTKVRSTHPKPEVGVMKAVGDALDAAAASELQYFVHGTTVGLNALLEGEGPRLALLSTRGFRDVLEIRRGDRDEPYNLFWRPPPTLIPRRLRFSISERIWGDGSVLTPLAEDDVREALEALRAQEADAIVIAFLNAYANPEHELAAEQILRGLGYDGEITLSHRVSREYREYERTATTVVNGYIQPVVSEYLGRLEDALAGYGFGGTALIMRSGGGALTFGDGRRRPFETLLSGPVAGVEGAAAIARQMDFDRVITADVGGTSFDTALVVDGRPPVKHEGTIVGLPIQTTWVDVRSIGAGGGSIAHVDAGKLLRVGPRSAGADPGPAAYGLGGTEPTVTDAAVRLGMLPVDDLGEGLTLDRDRAEAALAPLADQLGLSTVEVARGVVAIVTAKMADAIREITVERGEDPRRAALLAFGGAGPLFATQLADELRLKSIVIPPLAGTFSAWGLLVADAVRTASRTRIVGLADAALEEVNAVFAELFGEIGATADAVDAAQPAQRETVLDLRYVGQEHCLTVEVESEDGRLTADAESIQREFKREYVRAYGVEMDDPVEIVGIRAFVRRRLHAVESFAGPNGNGDGGQAAAREVEAYSLRRREWCAFRVVERSGLHAGDVVEGPAIVVESTTTTYLDADYVAKTEPNGCLTVTLESGEGE